MKTSARLLEMFYCGRLQNGVVRRLSESRSTEMHMAERVNVSDFFSNKPRTRTLRVSPYDILIIYVNVTYVTLLRRIIRHISL